MTALTLPAVSTVAPVYSGPDPLLLWSTNTFFKFRIQQDFLGGKHYVWCSPEFDGAKLSRYSISGAQPASSDPATIYRQLRAAIKTNDSHDAKIESQKSTLAALAVKLEADRKIASDARDEIVAMISHSSLQDWRPLIYVIPYANVVGRVNTVPRASRASHAPEYIITDLKDGEFRVIEPEAA